MPKGVYPRTYRPVLERAWAMVDRRGPDECWPWLGTRNFDGYGVVTIPPWDKPGRVGVHRVIYEALRGPIPEGFHIDHLCRVRHCVNPAHLEAVTHSENARRGNVARAADKTHCKWGHDLSTARMRKQRVGRQCRVCEMLRARRARARQANEGRMP